MRAIVLAAGLAVRLRPVTDDIPKCMVPVLGRPVLEYVIRHLVRAGIPDIIINLHYRADTVVRHFGDGGEWGAKISYSYESDLLGTAGGVRKAQWFFEDEKPFLVWYGDTICSLDVQKFLDFHYDSRGVATLAVVRKSKQEDKGVVGLAGDRVVQFIEKPKYRVDSPWVNAGIYAFDYDVLRAVPPEGFADFGHNVFPQLLLHSDVFAYKLSRKEKFFTLDTEPELVKTRGRIAMEVLR